MTCLLYRNLSSLSISFSCPWTCHAVIFQNWTQYSTWAQRLYYTCSIIFYSITFSHVSLFGHCGFLVWLTIASYYLFTMAVCWLLYPISLGPWFLLAMPCQNGLYLKGWSSDHHCMQTGGMPSEWSRNGFCEVNVFTWPSCFSCGWGMTRAEICVW